METFLLSPKSIESDKKYMKNKTVKDKSGTTSTCLYFFTLKKGTIKGLGEQGSEIKIEDLHNYGDFFGEIKKRKKVIIKK